MTKAIHAQIRVLSLNLHRLSLGRIFGLGTIMLAALSLFAVSGCATWEERNSGWEERNSGWEERNSGLPYLHKIVGPNVWVRVPAGGLNLQEAIDWSGGWAQEHCEWMGSDKGTYFVAADRAILDKSEYEVMWRCCRPDDDCCLHPKSQGCSQD